MTRQQLLLAVRWYLALHPNERYGQALYNTAATFMPKAAVALSDTPVDCFYDNTKAEIFLAALFEEQDTPND